MLTLGVDAHKRLHEAVALDDAGREVGRKSRREALRALKRHLVRAVWGLWQECLAAPPAPAATAAA